MKNIITLTDANGLKLVLNSGHFYKPFSVYPNTYGTNEHGNCGHGILDKLTPFDSNYFRSDINRFISEIYTNNTYKKKIWGHHLVEEPSYFHWYHSDLDCLGKINENPLYFKFSEIPPLNVQQAITHFKSNTAGQKTIIMEVNHGKSINANTIDHEGQFNPPQYLALQSKSDTRDVFFEGSYTKFDGYSTDPFYWLNDQYSSISNSGPDNNHHYLGAFKTIEYAKNKASEAHKVIGVEGTSLDATYWKQIHSNISIKNANWLWFQTYNSVIHGADGVWFYRLDLMRNSGEINNFGNATDDARYERAKFPYNYQNFVGHLAKEIRYLVDKNIISSDPNTIVATKTDYADPNCIVPASTSYIPSGLPLNLLSEKRTENYGLRYTIRTNGTETFMIITNPLPISLSTTLNFSNSSNQTIQNSTGVSVFFENNQYPVSHLSYKVIRNSNVDLTNSTVGVQYNLNYTGNKQLPISFGPLDVKILKFISTPPNYNNGWNLLWSNFGRGDISSHVVKDNDIFYTADLDGDGTEELICVGFTTSNSTTDRIDVLKFVNQNWELLWTNNGVSTAGNGIYPYRNSLIVGDFNGDGKDELLGNDLVAWTTLFNFSNGNFQWLWSDNGSSSHPIRPYKDKIYSGDFNGDGKDEILGCDLPNGWTTMFKWNGIDFIWGDWSDNGNSHPIRTYRSKMLAGDYNSDGKTDFLGLSSSSTMFSYATGNWVQAWSNNGANNFNGWPYPTLTTDKILAGNLDADLKDELFFLQTGTAATKATSMDFKTDQSGWNSNWSATASPGTPFIDDWPLSDGGGVNTKYLLVKAKANEAKCLIAMRKFCNSYLVNMYQNIPGNNKSLIEEEMNNQELMSDVKIFPNPSNGKIQISSDMTKISGIEICDTRGYLVFDSKYDGVENIHVDLSDKPNGVYLIKLTDSQNFVTVRKFILNR